MAHYFVVQGRDLGPRGWLARPLHWSRPDMAESAMLHRLKQETATLHAVADEPRLALLATTVTPSAYRAFLVRTYAHEAPIEASFHLTPGLRELIDLKARSRMKLVKMDLRALGLVDPTRIPVGRRARPFRSLGEALGWMFVLERNTLLHGLVRRHLERKLPEQVAIAGNYLSSERGAAARWAELGHAMEQVGAADSGDLLFGATAAFRYQAQAHREDAPLRVRVA